MLVVTTTVRMVDGVHSHTTSTGPVVTLSLELVERPACLQQRLVDPPTASDDADSRPRCAGDGLLRAAGETDAGLVLVGGVADDGGVVSGSACEGAAVADFFLDVADDGAFWALGDGEDVADCEGSFFCRSRRKRRCGGLRLR